MKSLKYELVKASLSHIFLQLIASEGKPCSPYGFTRFIRDTFNVNLSSGTIYSAVYKLEREGFIKHVPNEQITESRARHYKITEKGKQHLETNHAETVSSLEQLKRFFQP